MTRLSHVRTQLGVVTLHYRRKTGRFETRNTWVGTDGKTHRTVIRQDPASAWNWYRHCQDNGHCRREFPLDGEA